MLKKEVLEAGSSGRFALDSALGLFVPNGSSADFMMLEFEASISSCSAASSATAVSPPTDWFT
jgi:hypothetical protein